MKIAIPCDSSSISLGADQVADKISKYYNSIEIIRTGSYGLYWLEPMLQVETTQGCIAFGPVTPADIEELLYSGFAENHALCLGKIDELDALKTQDRLTFSRCGKIDPLSIADYKKYGGFAGLQKALSLTSQQIIDEVKESGLRGRGGAAFPTGIKWQTTHDQDANQKYIVCNADEGDSGTFADRMIMEGDPLCIIEGMIIAGLAVGATKGFIYLRSEYPHARRILEEAIKLAYEAEYLGENIQCSGRQFNLELRIGAGSYICGEETALLESLEGKRGMIRYKPPLPATCGLFGKPTVVNNVISLATVPVILEKGAAHHASFGEGNSRGTITIQLAGNIKHPGLYEFAFGMSLKEILYDVGGGSASGRPIRAVQCGGPLGPFLSDKQFDLPITYENFAREATMVGHGGIVVFDDSVNMAQMAHSSMKFGADESCGKCTPCRIGTTRSYEVIDKIVKGIDPEKNKQILDDLCMLLEDGSLCAHGGLISSPVKSALQNFPEDFGLEKKVA